MQNSSVTLIGISSKFFPWTLKFAKSAISRDDEVLIKFYSTVLHPAICYLSMITYHFNRSALVASSYSNQCTRDDIMVDFAPAQGKQWYLALNSAIYRCLVSSRFYPRNIWSFVMRAEMTRLFNRRRNCQKKIPCYNRNIWISECNLYASIFDTYR